MFFDFNISLDGQIKLLLAGLVVVCWFWYLNFQVGLGRESGRVAVHRQRCCSLPYGHCYKLVLALNKTDHIKSRRDFPFGELLERRYKTVENVYLDISLIERVRRSHYCQSVGIDESDIVPKGGSFGVEAKHSDKVGVKGMRQVILGDDFLVWVNSEYIR